MAPESRPGLDREQALLDVVASMMSQASLGDLVRDLTEKLSRFVAFDRMGLLLYDEARQVVVLGGSYAASPPPLPLGYMSPVDQTPAGEVIREQKRFYIPDASVETRYANLMKVVRELRIHALCYLPLTSPSRRIGALAFGTVSEVQYSEQDLAFMEDVLKPVAIAVENILNRERVETERDRLKLMLEVNNELVTKRDTQELFEQVSQRLQKLVPHDYFSLAVWDPDDRQLRLRIATNPDGVPTDFMDLPLPLEGSPSGEVFVSGKPQIFDFERLSHTAEVVRDLVAQRKIRCLCRIPLNTAHGRIGVIGVGSRQDGAYTPEIVEPLEEIAGQLAIAVENALTFGKLEEANRHLNEAKLYLEEELAEASSEEILGSTPVIRKVLQQIETVAPTDATVLIFGETGSGKELVARALHQKSPRARHTFVKLNCAAIPLGLLESELFGHEKGAFTGAIAQKVGRFEIAHQGTLFLDEIGEVPLELQPKLLRVLQDKEFERLGGNRTIRSDARLVAATNRDLKKMAETHQFRSDLYYRLNVFPIVVPPLRERKEDIPTLAMHFTQECSRRFGKKIIAIPSEAVERLVAYPWPGNIRELQNLIERSVILTSGDTLRIPLQELEIPGATSPSGGTLEAVERQAILDALRETGGVIGGPKGAAVRLGMKRTTLLYRMEKLGIRDAR
jgi:formate hydrogenlyase transcriptional activator